MLADKRRLLRDEEAKLHEAERKIRDKQFQERTVSERLKNEYEDLRGRFEQMAMELRFSIEDELKIYSRLLDELMKKSPKIVTPTTNTTTTTQQGGGSTSGTTYSTISSTIRSGGIEDHNAPSSFQNIRSHSSTGGAGNVTFDLGAGSSTWPDAGNANYETTTTTTTSGGNSGLFRSNDNDTYDTSSIARSSSYSHLN